jgi:hypothetical protein
LGAGREASDKGSSSNSKDYSKTRKPNSSRSAWEQRGKSVAEDTPATARMPASSGKLTEAGVGAEREVSGRGYTSNSKDASKTRKPTAAGVEKGRVANGSGYTSNSKDASKARKPTVAGVGAGREVSGKGSPQQQQGCQHHQESYQKQKWDREGCQRGRE